MFKDKIFMITGGTGSFGSTMLRHLIKTNIREIRVFSRDEKKQEDLRIALADPRIRFFIGDVRDDRALLEATHEVDYIFHAAALKQVPSCEFYPSEAIQTNVLGTQNVIEVAIKNRVKKVIFLSTDKAVYPINTMGLSKAMMEKLMQAKARLLKDHITTLCAIRYGNIIASRGSVIPLFISQIKTKKPLTITDPKMTRFMMSLEDSITLVLYALEHGRQGDIFVQKSPAATIHDIAMAIKSLFTATNEIQIIGTRHGEKLYETLVSREEMLRADDLGEYYRIPLETRDLNYQLFTNNGDPNIELFNDYTSHNTQRLSMLQLKELLHHIPSFQTELPPTQNQSKQLFSTFEEFVS
jgi:UDP-N-acetylglucosamine 4,6-dehydratase